MRQWIAMTAFLVVGVFTVGSLAETANTIAHKYPRVCILVLSGLISGLVLMSR